jgi:Mg2+ and Co2+ transporter CorA
MDTWKKLKDFTNFNDVNDQLTSQETNIEDTVDQTIQLQKKINSEDLDSILEENTKLEQTSNEVLLKRIGQLEKRMNKNLDVLNAQGQLIQTLAKKLSENNGFPGMKTS